MIHSFWFVAETAAGQTPTELWHWQGTPIMIGWSLLVLFIASRTIKLPHVGPEMPLGPLAPIFNRPSVATVLASVSFGHILGVLTIFGLAPYLQ
ncbi:MULTISPECIES: photosystem I reaction center subunit X [Cyanophyceae]|uniref:Photosystem I reaction center subunit X n=1 Tax=Stenomitos frigidus AS-A4 TaxID=2933935 RepID=A0ABV0KH72_9CYAN|nr:photosystem I reaction center subunit X [Phormidium sp. FACHB-592]